MEGQPVRPHEPYVVGGATEVLPHGVAGGELGREFRRSHPGVTLQAPGEGAASSPLLAAHGPDVRRGRAPDAEYGDGRVGRGHGGKDAVLVAEDRPAGSAHIDRPAGEAEDPPQISLMPRLEPLPGGPVEMDHHRTRAQRIPAYRPDVVSTRSPDGKERPLEIVVDDLPGLTIVIAASRRQGDQEDDPAHEVLLT